MIPFRHVTGADDLGITAGRNSIRTKLDLVGGLGSKTAPRPSARQIFSLGTHRPPQRRGWCPLSFVSGNCPQAQGLVFRAALCQRGSGSMRHGHHGDEPTAGQNSDEIACSGRVEDWVADSEHCEGAPSHPFSPRRATFLIATHAGTEYDATH